MTHVKSLMDMEVRFCHKHGYVKHRNIFDNWCCQFCSYENSIKEIQTRQVYNQRQNFLINLKNANLDDSVPVRDWEVFSQDLHQEQVLEAMQKWLVEALHSKEPKNLILQGGVGTGKTFCAKSLGRAFCGMGQTARFHTSKKIIEIYKARYTNPSESFEEYKKFVSYLTEVDCLIIDDVGNHDGDNAIILDVLEQRHTKRKPTILTTNLDFKGVNEYFGERVKDRFYQNCTTLIFDWQSYRSLKRRSAMAEIV